MAAPSTEMRLDMTSVKRKLASLASSKFAVPAVLLITTGLAYGLSFWRLGFYWDDQPISWIRYQLGPAAIRMYFSDSRPAWGVLFDLTGYLLPYKPAYWQLFGMLWRAAGAIMLWLVMERLFPQRRYGALLLSLLVLLYPGFNQQSVSYLFSHFFIVLFFLVCSWYLMLRKQTIPAAILSALNLMMLEYFFTLEFIRPLLIFRSLRDEPTSMRERVVRTLKMWIPYIGAILAAVLFRVLVYTHPGFGYSLTNELIRAPEATSVRLVGQVLTSLWLTVVAAWLQAFHFPNPIINGARTTALYVAVVVAAGALAFSFRHLARTESERNARSDALWITGLGVLLLMLGGIPFWQTNVPVSLAFPASRSTLSFMFGACFLLIGLMEFLPIKLRYLLPLALIALSAGRQFLWTVDFARDWQSTKNLFWQMYWRAPGIQPNTMVLLNEGPLQFYADNSLTPPLNWIYDPHNRSGAMDYVLFYPTSRRGGTLPELSAGQPVRYDFLAEVFNGSTSQALSFYYAPPGCLRLLDPVIDAENHLIPDDSMMREAATLSSSQWITSASDARMPGIYGPEPPHNWCYYFEQAGLAAQMGEWSRVVQLGDKAFGLDDYPNDPVERFVFIEGYAHEGNWARAKELAMQSYKVSPHYVGPLLCKLLDRMNHDLGSSSTNESSLNDLRTKFSCLP